MTDARQRSFWHRAGPLVGVSAIALVAASASQGCSDGSSNSTSSSSGAGGNTSSSSSTSTSTSTSTSSSGSGMGGGSGGLSLKTAADTPLPLDATPDPEGLTVYFTAIGANGPGVFSVPADGSNTKPNEIFAGDPFASPFGIAIDTAGKQLYIADPGADAANDKGAIFVLPVGGGMPTILAGSEDTVPRSLEVAQENGKDVIYFTGIDKATGLAGVLKLSASGGAATPVVTGAPFLDPSGITVTKTGDIYVADTVSAVSRTANIIKISGGQATTLISDLHTGYPAGLAVSADEKTLYVSAFDPATLTDAIALVNIASASSSLFTTGIDTFSESAGLHRAKNAPIFAWADSHAGTAGGGKVFVVK